MSLFEVSSFELQHRSLLWHVSKMEPALKWHEWCGLITVASCVRVELGGAENGSSRHRFFMNILMHFHLTSMFEVLMRGILPRARGERKEKVISK